MQLPQPYLLFLGDVTDPTFAKTAFGLRDWARERCLGEWSCSENAVTLGLPRLSPPQAHASGARSMVIGVANIGGKIVDSWLPHLLSALAAGLDVVSGMHAQLADTPALKAAAERYKRRLIDVRTPPQNIPIANGRKRTGKRLLTVGTDCALGKKYTALTIACVEGARRRCGLSCDGADGNHDRRGWDSDGCGGVGVRRRSSEDVESGCGG